MPKILESSTVFQGDWQSKQDYIWRVYSLLLTTESIPETLPKLNGSASSNAPKARSRFQTVVRQIICALREVDSLNLKVMCGTTEPVVTNKVSFVQPDRLLPIPHESFLHRSWCLLLYLNLLASLILYSEMSYYGLRDDEVSFLTAELITVELLFFTDLLMSFVVLYDSKSYQKDELGYSVLSKTCRQYIGSWFLLDLFCVIPWHLFIPHWRTNRLIFHLCMAVKFFRILHVFRLRGSVKYFLRDICAKLPVFSPTAEAMAILMLLFLQAVTYFLYLGCSLVILRTFFIDGEDLQDTFYSLLVEDISFVVLTAATVGNSSIDVDYVVLILLIVASFLFFGYTMSRMGLFLTKIGTYLEISRLGEDTDIEEIYGLAAYWEGFVRTAKDLNTLDRIVCSIRLYSMACSKYPSLPQFSSILGEGRLFKKMVADPFLGFKQRFSYLTKCLDQEGIWKIYCSSELRIYLKDEPVILRGYPSTGLYLVDKGELSLYNQDIHPGLALGTLSTGCMCGESWLIGNESESFDVIVTSKTASLLFIPIEALSGFGTNIHSLRRVALYRTILWQCILVELTRQIKTKVRNLIRDMRQTGGERPTRLVEKFYVERGIVDPITGEDPQPLTERATKRRGVLLSKIFPNKHEKSLRHDRDASEVDDEVQQYLLDQVAHEVAADRKPEVRETAHRLTQDPSKLALMANELANQFGVIVTPSELETGQDGEDKGGGGKEKTRSLVHRDSWKQEDTGSSSGGLSVYLREPTAIIINNLAEDFLQPSNSHHHEPNFQKKRKKVSFDIGYQELDQVKAANQQQDHYPNPQTSERKESGDSGSSGLPNEWNSSLSINKSLDEKDHDIIFNFLLLRYLKLANAGQREEEVFEVVNEANQTLKNENVVNLSANSKQQKSDPDPPDAAPRLRMASSSRMGFQTDVINLDNISEVNQRSLQLVDPKQQRQLAQPDREGKDHLSDWVLLEPRSMNTPTPEQHKEFTTELLVNKFKRNIHMHRVREEAVVSRSRRKINWNKQMSANNLEEIVSVKSSSKGGVSVKEQSVNFTKTPTTPVKPKFSLKTNSFDVRQFAIEEDVVMEEEHQLESYSERRKMSAEPEDKLGLRLPSQLEFEDQNDVNIKASLASDLVYDPEATRGLPTSSVYSEGDVIKKNVEYVESTPRTHFQIAKGEMKSNTHFGQRFPEGRRKTSDPTQPQVDEDDEDKVTKGSTKQKSTQSALARKKARPEVEWTDASSSCASEQEGFYTDDVVTATTTRLPGNSRMSASLEIEPSSHSELQLKNSFEAIQRQINVLNSKTMRVKRHILRKLEKISADYQIFLEHIRGKEVWLAHFPDEDFNS